MFQVTRSAVLNAKPEEVWDLVGGLRLCGDTIHGVAGTGLVYRAGFQSLPDWHPLISSSTPGMLGDVETRRLGLVPVPDGVSYEREIGRDTMSYRRRADVPSINRGDAAAATWIFRGHESLRRHGRVADIQRASRRRGRDVDIPWARVAAAAATWTFRGSRRALRDGYEVFTIPLPFTNYRSASSRASQSRATRLQGISSSPRRRRDSSLLRRADAATPR